jgi:hypothetical protein
MTKYQPFFFDPDSTSLKEAKSLPQPEGGSAAQEQTA